MRICFYLLTMLMCIAYFSTLLLDGAGKGILFFITPQWNKLLNLEVSTVNNQIRYKIYSCFLLRYFANCFAICTLTIRTGFF